MKKVTSDLKHSLIKTSDVMNYKNQLIEKKKSQIIVFKECGLTGNIKFKINYTQNYKQYIMQNKHKDLK